MNVEEKTTSPVTDEKISSIEKKVDELSVKMSQAIDSIMTMIKTLFDAVTKIDTQLSEIESRINNFDEFSKKLMPIVLTNQDMIASVAEGVNRVGDGLMSSVKKTIQLIEALSTSSSMNIAKIREDIGNVQSNLAKTQDAIENKLVNTLSSLVKLQKKIESEMNELDSKIGGEAVEKLIDTSMELSSQLQNAMHMITINQLISRIDELTRRIFSSQPVVIAPMATQASAAPAVPAESTEPKQTSAKQHAASLSGTTAEKKEKKEKEEKEEGIEQTQLLKPSMLFGRG